MGGCEAQLGAILCKQTLIWRQKFRRNLDVFHIKPEMVAMLTSNKVFVIPNKRPRKKPAVGIQRPIIYVQVDSHSEGTSQ
jgi:hypothetical protein